MLCPNCGAKMPENSSICSNCGAQIIQSDDPASGRMPDRNATPQNNYQGGYNQPAAAGQWGQPMSANGYQGGNNQPTPGGQWGQPMMSGNGYQGGNNQPSAYGPGNQAPYGYTAPPKKSNSKLIIIIVVAVLVIAASAVTLFFVMRNRTGDSRESAKTTVNASAELTGADSAITQPVTDADVAATTDPADNSDVESIIAKGKLVVGITDYAPMDYKDDYGEWTGFDAECARAVADRMGVTVEFMEIDWDNKFLELNAGGIDCIWNGMTITDEVRLNSDVTTAYAQNKQVVVMPADRLAYYTTFASLANLSFAVEAGSAGQMAAEDNGLSFTAVTSQYDALYEVASGASDAAIIDSTTAYAMTGAGTDHADLGVGVFLTEEEYGIGCRKGSDLVDVINRYMQELLIDGTLAGLAEKYHVEIADALRLAVAG
ncbi:MAG: transporter substrate-binding domain-containing protein [Clostridia bacterium]|nr:transporter substrate-binding domain-containing protein [Clostridia bacterium]